MGFSRLLGNEQLKKTLTTAISRGRISHFYLICGPEGSGKRTLAQLLSAAILCKDAAKPCLQCSACRKVLSGIHPDLITVTDPEHKAIPVDMVRQIRDQMFIRPNEADRKIYIFAQELNVQGQNALLKILEEPPSYGVFILLSENPDMLLPTVRSRATELRLQCLDRATLQTQLQAQFPDASEDALQAAIERSGGYLGQAKALLEQEQPVSEQTAQFAKAFSEHDSLLLTQLLVGMEKWSRDRLLQELTQWAMLLQQALVCRSGMPITAATARQLSSQCSSAQLYKGLQQLRNAIDYTQANVSPAAVCGHLVWSLR